MLVPAGLSPGRIERKQVSGVAVESGTEVRPGASPTGRTSSKRSAIAAVLEETSDFRSAQDIHEMLRRSGPKVGLATVYRTLQAMHAAGEVDALRGDTGEVTYRSCSQSHHHHLVCRECGRAVEVKGPAVEKWADATAAEHGFSDVSHTVEIFGICADH